MKIAIFSDVHGNRFALEAVLADIREFKPGEILNLGDQIWGGADPAGAWRIQRDLGIRGVRGNTDERIAQMVENGDKAEQYRAWVLEQTGPEPVEALGALPLTLEAVGGEIVVAHGSLESAWEPLMFTERKKKGGYRPARPAELLERARAFPEAKVFVVGHTHQERFLEVEGRAFVNAGPVSRPKDGSAWARWIALERRDGAWSVTFRRVAYDVEAAARWAEAHAPHGPKEARHLRLGLEQE
ncbi:putative phosphodiesterase [Deinobacterium chartae]|uniref:Putative phosphodiesterase n=1 Tax=Deinobacterium chartae TaxID=521158 RepID=A0A841I6P8_9DEIO|nr:metallophosphoesterase family protein [Deinobacterium chartae]MBB6099505.1 putative phosphodiesterase [Deinobacterium chartae]